VKKISFRRSKQAEMVEEVVDGRSQGRKIPEIALKIISEPCSSVYILGTINCQHLSMLLSLACYAVSRKGCLGLC